MEAAEGMFAERRFGPAAAEFERVLTEYLAPILAADAQYAQAIELETRAKTRIAEARKQETAAVKPVKPPPLVPKPGPGDVTPRPGESYDDWMRRNTEVRQDYALAKKYYDNGDNLAAMKLFADLAGREPGYLDVSAYVKNAQERLDEQRRQALNAALVLEGEGHKATTARNWPEAASKLTAAREAFQRAAVLEIPAIDKHLADNLDRRRVVGKGALDTARTHANQRNRPEARKWYQLVIDLLPAGEPLRKAAEDELSRVAPGV
jgi:tetratricopeptide (TPR) repeat protein